MRSIRRIVRGWLVATCAVAGAVGCIDGAAPGAEDALGVRADAITAANFAFNGLQFAGSGRAVTQTVVSTQLDNVTLEAWVRWDGGAGVIAYNGNSSTSGFGLYAQSTGAVSVLLGGNGWVDCDGCRLARGVWSHVAAVRDTGQWRFSQDGIPRHAALVNDDLPFNLPTGQFSIGAAPLGGDPLKGAVDEVRFWDVALTGAMLEATDRTALVGDEPGLVAYYRLDEGAGQASVDASPGHHTLALGPGAIWISSGATLSTGISRDALQFTGTEYGHTSTVITQRTDDITLETWVRWDGGQQPQVVLYNGNSASNGYGFYLVPGGLVTLRLGSTSQVICQSCRVLAGVWTHLAAVRSASRWTIYQDGAAQQVPNGNLAAIAPQGVLSIGASSSGGDRLIGAIDEVRIWDIARTAQQIAASYTVSLPADEPDLIAYYRMDDGGGAVATDAAGSHAMALVDAPLWVTSGALLATAQR